MRTPGACGGVKWGQTSLSFRLGIKGILRTAAEQLLGLPFLGRSRSVGKESFSRWSGGVCLSPTESDARLRSKSKRETKKSCHCSMPLTEFMLRVQSLKPKPNQIPLETSTDFVSITFLPPTPDNKTVSPSS